MTRSLGGVGGGGCPKGPVSAPVGTSGGTHRGFEGTRAFVLLVQSPWGLTSAAPARRIPKTVKFGGRAPPHPMWAPSHTYVPVDQRGFRINECYPAVVRCVFRHCAVPRPVVRSVRVRLRTLTFHGNARLHPNPPHCLCTLGLGDTEGDLLRSHAQVLCRKTLVLVEFLFKSAVC